MKLTVCDQVTGQVLRIVECGIEDAELQAGAGEFWVMGVPPSLNSWYEAGEFSLVPPRSSLGHEWNWTAKSWFDPRTLEQAKFAKNAEIDAAREAANRSHFVFQGKQIAADDMSMKDILATNGDVQNLGSFVTGWPGGWKAMNGTGFVAIPDVATWHQFFRAMVTQGAVNFAQSQARKATLDAATTVAEVEAVTW